MIFPFPLGARHCVAIFTKRGTFYVSSHDIACIIWLISMIQLLVNTTLLNTYAFTGIDVQLQKVIIWTNTSIFLKELFIYLSLYPTLKTTLQKFCPNSVILSTAGPISHAFSTHHTYYCHSLKNDEQIRIHLTKIIMKCFIRFHHFEHLLRNRMDNSAIVTDLHTPSVVMVY